jgi:arylamine N-acetyltransferase
VLQAAEGDRWVDQYGMLAHPVPLVDVETINWWASTHPRSPFVTGLMVSTQAGDGSRTSLSDWGELALTERTPTTSSVTPVAREALPELLAARFALDGFALGAGGRLVRANERVRRGGPRS